MLYCRFFVIRSVNGRTNRVERHYSLRSANSFFKTEYPWNEIREMIDLEVHVKSGNFFFKSQESNNDVGFDSALF